MSEKFPADIECPLCNGEGCEHCDEGWYSVTQCPSEYIGPQMISDIRIVAASDTHLPVAGGLFDQSAYWFELRGLLKSEEDRVQADQWERKDRE